MQSSLFHTTLQAAVRSKHGEETTAFERITDGARTAAAGDVVRINAKPQLVGRVLYFTIPQASLSSLPGLSCVLQQAGTRGAGQWGRCPAAWAARPAGCCSPPAQPNLWPSPPQATRDEGAYANGRVHIELLPAEVYGTGCEKQFSLRRLEAVLSEAEQQEHLQREMLKARGWCLRLQGCQL